MGWMIMENKRCGELRIGVTNCEDGYGENMMLKLRVRESVVDEMISWTAGKHEADHIVIEGQTSVLFQQRQESFFHEEKYTVCLGEVYNLLGRSIPFDWEKYTTLLGPKTYEELSDKEKLQAHCDLKATNIVLQGLPPDVYALVNHHKVAKEIWDRVKLLTQGTSLTKQEREVKLYAEFDNFTHVKGETLYEYYLRFTQLINDMNIIKMTMQTVQVNTKFLNSLPLEWGKFVTDVKLAKDLYTSSYDQLYAYLPQHEYTTPQYQQQFSSPTHHMYSSLPQSNPYGSPLHLHQYPNTHPYNPIVCLNKAMAFMSAVFSPRYPPTNNQLRSSSNPRNQATVQDGRITVQQSQVFANIVCFSSIAQFHYTFNAQVQQQGGYTGDAQDEKLPVMMDVARGSRLGAWLRACCLFITPSKSKGEFKGMLPVQEEMHQAEGKQLDEEQLAFMVDPEVADDQVAQTITHNAAFQTDDLDAYDSDCDDISSAKAILMANLSSCDPETLSEVPYSDTFQNDMINQKTQQASVQNINTFAHENSMILSMFEQMSIHATSWEKANYENKIVNESLIAELNRYKERVKFLEQRVNVDLSDREKFIDSQMDDMIQNRNNKFVAFEVEIDTLKQALSKNVKEKESLLTTLNGFKMEFKQKEAKYIDKEIVLEKKNKELENIVYKLYQSSQVMHMLTKPQVFYDDTYKKALGYQNPFYLKRAQRIKPVLYDGNVLSKTHDVISVANDEERLIIAEECRLKMVEKQNDPIILEKKINLKPISYSELNRFSDKNSKNPSTSNTPVRVEVPSELPKVSMVNKSLKKLRFLLTNFDKVVKVRTTPNAIEEGSWGFEHTKKVFVTEIIPSLNKLKESFNEFDKGLLDEITEVQAVFTQMEIAVEQCSVDRKCCEIQHKQVLIENDRLMDQIISQNIVNLVLNLSGIICEYVNMDDKSVDTCKKCLKLEAEFVKKNDVFNELSKRFSNLEQHCISFEVAMQLTELQEKDTMISKLKEKIHALRDNPDNVKKDIDEIETIIIELEHSVAKLLSENERLHKEIAHLKQIFKDQFDLIKKTHVSNKEHNDSLIAQMNSKSLENVDLKVQIQEKATTIFLEMFKIVVEPLPPKLFKDKSAHIDYIQQSREHADVLRELVEDARASSPLDNNVDSAYRLIAITPKNKDTKVRPTDPVTSLKPSAKLVVVTPINKNKKVRFVEPVTQDSNPPLLHSTKVICSTSASGSKPTRNTKNNRILQPSSSNKTNNVEDQSRDVKSRKNKKNRVIQTECHAVVMQSMCNANSKSLCAICNECLFDANHDKCVLHYVYDVNVSFKSKSKRKNKKQIWKPTGKVFTSTKVVPPKETPIISVPTPTPGLKVYSRRPKAPKSVVQIVLWYLDSGCSRHMTGDCSQLTNFVNKFLGTVKFGNNQIAKIMGYSDYQIGNVTISRVYYTEGLGHNLFFVG
ncbi:hypothetical protein Tco_0016095 [Tanacetum coccineum]